jgi:hypothetical protein
MVIGPAADEHHVAGRELDRRSRILEPQPRPTPYNGVEREFDRARKPQTPRWPGDRPGEYAARRTCPGEVLLQRDYHDPIGV